METTPLSPSSQSSLASPSSMEFYDFLDRMRNPASLDLVRSIKSFIVSFSFYPANPENDGKKVQDFFMTMEGALRDHPLWAGASDKEIDCAMEGLEKYVMTKLFSRTFACSPEDSKADREIAEKISLLQTFLRPEHLDIPAILRNEASWLLAEKELQKMNSFKAPREKLLCIMNCCRVINNLLLNASISENHVLAGADDFLPVLIYVTIKGSTFFSLGSSGFNEIEFGSLDFSILVKFLQNRIFSGCDVCLLNNLQKGLEAKSKRLLHNVSRPPNANPPQLHSNLKFIQLYRRQAKLVSEAAYYLTNLISAKSFIADLNARSLSINEIEFEENMQAARGANKLAHDEPDPAVEEIAARRRQGNPGPSFTMSDKERIMKGRSTFPFVEAKADELTVGDVERLLSIYKDVVNKYTHLSEAFRQLSLSKPEFHHLEGTGGSFAQPPQISTRKDKESVEGRGE